MRGKSRAALSRIVSSWRATLVVKRTASHSFSGQGAAKACPSRKGTRVSTELLNLNILMTAGTAGGDVALAEFQNAYGTSTDYQQWRGATGQETCDGDDIGFVGDPVLVHPGTDDIIGCRAERGRE